MALAIFAFHTFQYAKKAYEEQKKAYEIQNESIKQQSEYQNENIKLQREYNDTQLNYYKKTIRPIVCVDSLYVVNKDSLVDIKNYT